MSSVQEYAPIPPDKLLKRTPILDGILEGCFEVTPADFEPTAVEQTDQEPATIITKAVDPTAIETADTIITKPVTPAEGLQERVAPSVGGMALFASEHQQPEMPTISGTLTEQL
jgi:hypothetical protein